VADGRPICCALSVHWCQTNAPWGRRDADACVHCRVGVRPLSPAPEWKRACALATRRRYERLEQRRGEWRGEWREQGDNRGLYEAIATLPPGKHLQYHRANGITVALDVDVTVTGAWYTVLRAQTIDVMGQPRVTRRGYTISRRADCRELDQALRDLGIDPDAYTVA
jgi:hypothetical protein